MERHAFSTRHLKRRASNQEGKSKDRKIERSKDRKIEIDGKNSRQQRKKQETKNKTMRKSLNLSTKNFPFDTKEGRKNRRGKKNTPKKGEEEQKKEIHQRRKKKNRRRKKQKKQEQCSLKLVSKACTNGRWY